MEPDPTINPAPPAIRKSTIYRYTHPLVLLSAMLLTVWLLVSYLLLPDWWEDRSKKHPALLSDQAPRITLTGASIPGDALNLFVTGTEHQLVLTLLAAGWHPADPVTWKTSLRIAESSLFHRPYPDAPVSNLFLFGRKEDLAFEKPVGNDARRRHHVRFWQAPEKDEQGNPAWWAAATFDNRVGFSHTTGQITHHISPEIDQERDGLMNDLAQTQRTAPLAWKTGFQQIQGRNGGGDAWHSDGRLGLVQLKETPAADGKPSIQAAEHR